MALHELVTVKKAAAALGVDREVIRNMIDIGAIRGERRMVRNKEKWFIYESVFQEMMEEQGLLRKEDRVDVEGLNEFFTSESSDIESEIGNSAEIAELFDSNGVTTESELIEESLFVTEVDEQAEDNPDRKYLVPDSQSLDKLLESLTIEFANRLCEERQLVCNLQQKLAEKTEILNSLPDLKQTIEDAKSDLESKDAEISALKCDVAALENDLSKFRTPWWKRLLSLQ